MFRSFLTFLLLVSVNASSPEAVTPSASFDPFFIIEVARIPSKKPEAVGPVIQAKAAMIMDVNSGLVLYEKNAQTPLPMASLAKIMTALLILENHTLDEIVTISDSYSSLQGTKIGLIKGEKITVGDLLVGLLVRSGGDAAMALAEVHSGSVEKFIEAMNERARDFNLRHTQFKNPVGLDEEGQYSTAYDLALLAKYAMRNPVFRAIVVLPQAEIFSVDGRFRHVFQSTNKLLGSYLNVLGVKTGTTEAAGESIINLARHPTLPDQEIMVVLLNSPSRFQESKSLFDWSFRNYLW